ncbi:NAD(P)-dependent dehydrogenase (short-subunit alcohol dehydrogenase family) [Sphingobium fontiphilum]|uniref:NAD(P)-dependent dehydrogenase (Short-subunit alcohol dehydrogenase family) n=1 Tax=Sphingobium fontiphilum TaxID=944425 RepID=A0A7W6GMB5_9SPHN|nr:SDR family oxidoreductase [Sphingobium fontiphilum]MBB3981031.1 NAD(P)-dependent dehydrogenase (short-subunit alcohol dehydrogenase family) [Sphingobium fontiphilum]
MANLSGKVALITGGTSGIGRACVGRLTADGAKVVFTGSNAEKAQSLCEATGATFIRAAVQDPADWARVEALIRNDFGRLDIAFANAGTERGDANVEAVTLEAWNDIVGINQTGVLLTIKSAIALMKHNPQGPGGSIIVNSSMNANRALSNYISYSVTKAAVVAMVKATAIHCGLEKLNIRCNAILPGVVETDMIAGIIASCPDPDAARAAYEGMSPMGRMAKLEEVAGLVAYLSSDEAAFINGADYAIDGATTAGMTGV